MLTTREWEDFLYSCDLEGQLWLHVNRVGAAYICWRLEILEPQTGGDKVQKMMDAFAADPTNADLRLAEFLSEQHYGAGAVLTVVSEENIGKIIRMLHFIVRERPIVDKWAN